LGLHGSGRQRVKDAKTDCEKQDRMRAHGFVLAEYEAIFRDWRALANWT
jgi:hypothetical protein